MAYDYNSRLKWEKEKLEEWDRIHEKQIGRLSQQKRKLFDELFNFSDYPHCGFPVITKWGREKVKASAGKLTLKEILYKECPEIIDILVPELYREDFDYMLDQFAYFQYSRSLFRPTVRTTDPAAHMLDAFGLMQGYKVLGIFGITPLEYLTEKRTGYGDTPIDAELLDFKRSDTFARKLHMVQFEDILAARIDRNDTAVLDAVREAILSDNNTVMITVPLIRGIVKSRNTELHELLAKFLVAARLQEGVSYTGNVDEETTDLYYTPFLAAHQTLRSERLLVRCEQAKPQSQSDAGRDRGKQTYRSRNRRSHENPLYTFLRIIVPLQKLV